MKFLSLYKEMPYLFLTGYFIMLVSAALVGAVCGLLGYRGIEPMISGAHLSEIVENLVMYCIPGFCIYALSKNRKMQNVLILGCIFLFSEVLFIIFSPYLKLFRAINSFINLQMGPNPFWFDLLLVAMILPATMAGGFFARKVLSK